MTGVWYPVVLPLALLATCVFFFPSHKAISFRTFKAFLISCDHGQVKKALENWSCKKLSEVTQRSHMQVYSSRFPSRKPKSEKWGQWISSRQYCNNRLLLLSLISDMCNPKNWKSSSTAKWNCSKSGWIRVLQIHRQGRPGKCVFLCDLDWQLAIETSETKPRRAPASIQCTGVRQTNNGCVQAYFFLPSPFPLLYFDVWTSPLESFSDLPQLAVSLNVQIDRTVKYACFAGLDLRSGNTDNKWAWKWCFEIIRT